MTLSACMVIRCCSPNHARLQSTASHCSSTKGFLLCYQIETLIQLDNAIVKTVSMSYECTTSANKARFSLLFFHVSCLSMVVW